MSVVAFELRSATTQAAAPFSLGHAFKRGDVPAGSQIIASIADFQCTPKCTWPDGSLRIAVLGGRAALTAGVPASFTLSIGTPAGGTALNTADLKATGVTASVGAGAFGTVSWADTDWDAPHEVWVSGPKMSWFRYRKQIGVDAHLTAWLDVRVWSGGEVAAKAWVENGYWNVAAPTNKSATYTFTLGGAQRYSGALDIKHHTRVPLLSGSGLEHWLVSDPVVTPDIDRNYLTSTGLIPKYDADVTTSELSSIASSFTPNMIGGYVYDGDFMPSTGYQKAIGILPEHDVGFLLCEDDRALVWRSVLRNGYAVGRYPIHYRDELSATKAPPKFSTYSHMSVYDDDSIYGSGNANTKTPINSGGTNARWELAHQPNVGYLPYLLSGDKYHLETAVFAANVTYFAVTPNLPEVSDPVRIYPVPGSNMQTRAVAWSIGALTRALAIMPDTDADSRPEYIDLIERIFERFHRIYLEQAHNDYGWIQPGEYYDTINGGCTHSVWQMGFFTGAVGMAVSLDLPIASDVKTKLNAFFQWNAKSIVTLLGPQSGFWYVNAAPYRLAVSTAQYPDYSTGTGPWLSPSSSYAATYSVSQNFTPSVTEGVLAAEFDSGTWGRNIWGNLHLPIVYAVQHGVPGAQDAYDRLTGASNYGAIQNTFDAGSPVWALVPASISAPAESAPMGPTLNIDVESRFPGKLVIGNTGLGVLGQNVAGPVGGVAGYLYGVFDDALHADREVSGPILTRPSAGNIKFYEDGAYSFTDAPDGIYNFTFQPKVGNTPYGPVLTEELVVGGTQAAASWTEGADIIAVAGTFTEGVAGSIAWTEGADIIEVAATYEDGIAAVIGWIEGEDLIEAILDFVAATPVDASIGWTESGDSIEAGINVAVPVSEVGLAVSLAEARYYARVDGTEHDIGLLISIATYAGEAEHITGRKIINTPYVLKFDAFPDAIQIPAAPLDSITLFTYVDVDGVERTLPAEAYRVDDMDRITPALGTTWPETKFVADAVKVSLVCGYGANHTTTPPAFKAYILAKIAEEFNPPRIPRPDFLIRLLDGHKVYR